jgi:hypothetical protein
MSLFSMRAAPKGRSARADRLRGAVSILAFAAGGFGLAAAGSAQAACPGTPITITASSGTTQLDSGSSCASSVTITSGTTGYVTPNWGYIPNITNKGYVPLVDNAGALSTNPANAAQNPSGLAPELIVQQGATLVIGGAQTLNNPYAPFAPGAGPYIVLDNMLNAAGDVKVEGDGVGSQTALTGASTITGNLTLEDGAQFRIGEYYVKSAGVRGYYGASTINFGPTTNVSLGNNAYLFMNLASPATIGGALSSAASGEVELYAGTVTVNGANTTANPFLGSLVLDPGTTFVVGDSAHTGAIFGDPSNTTNPSLTLDIQRPQGGTPVTLMGYGTIYANVVNAGVVVPGGAKGVLGTLTVSNYTQTSTGILDISVTPTGASRLNVLGNATLNGTLALNIASGNYGNQVIPVVTTGGTLTIEKGFTVETTGSEAAGLAETSNSIDIVTEKTSSLQVYGHLVQADRDYINAFNDMLYDAQTDALSGGGGAPKTTYGDGVTAWVAPFGQTSTISHAGYGYNDNAAGLTAGFERRWGAHNAIVGVAASYAGGQLTTDGGMTTANTNAYDAALYGGFDAPNARLEGALFVNGYDANVARNLGSSGTIDSSPGARAFGASLQISHGIDHNLFTPYLRATYANIDQSALTEAGKSLLALNVGNVQEGYFTTEAGFKIHPGGVFLKLPFGLRPEVTLAAVHDFSQTSGENVTGSFANLTSSPFTFAWKGDQGTAGLAGLLLKTDVNSHLQVFGKVDGEFSTYGRTGDLRLGGAYRF